MLSGHPDQRLIGLWGHNMPTYEYQCQKCEHCFEAIRRIDDRELPTKEPCPNCSEVGCVDLCIGAVGLVDVFSVSGLKRAPTPFREKMQQIKRDLPPRLKKNIRDY